MVTLLEVLRIVLPVLVGLALIAIATVVARHGRDHRHSLFFAALYFLSGMKSLSDGLATMADQFHAQASLFPPSVFWMLLGTFCALGMMPLLLLFATSFPRPLPWMTHHPHLAPLAFLPSALVALVLVLVITGRLGFGAFLDATDAFNVLFFAVTVVATVLLLRTRRNSPDPIERTQAGYVLLGFVPGFVTGWAISGLQIVRGGLVPADKANEATLAILHFVSPVLELAAAGLVAVAILKYNILGINPRFRLGVKSGLAGLMFMVLFLVTQFVENVVLQGKVFAFAGDYGSFILSGATGLVLFKPIEKVSGKVSDKLLPGAAAMAKVEAAAAKGEPVPAQAPPAAMLQAEQIYHAQATYVLRDAQVTERELAFLRNLRTQLGLGDEQARRIEEDVERLLKVDAPQTGQPAVGTARAPESAASHAAEVHSGELEVRRVGTEPATGGPPAGPSP